VAYGGEVEGPFQAGDTVRVTEKAWLLPDAHYSACIEKAMTVESLTTRLDRCTAEGKDALSRCDTSLSLCDKALAAASTQFDADEQTVSGLTSQILDLERALATAETDKAQLRNQRNTAWGIVGGVVLTVAGASAIALGSL
jgi:uncharacterized protein (DUF3084 family)